jgi:hypothetical protein
MSSHRGEITYSNPGGCHVAGIAGRSTRRLLAAVEPGGSSPSRGSRRLSLHDERIVKCHTTSPIP